MTKDENFSRTLNEVLPHTKGENEELWAVDDHVKTQQEGRHLHAKERGLRSNQIGNNLIRPPELRESKFLLFQPPIHL